MLPSGVSQYPCHLAIYDLSAMITAIMKCFVILRFQPRVCRHQLYDKKVKHLLCYSIDVLSQINQLSTSGFLNAETHIINQCNVRLQMVHKWLKISQPFIPFLKVQILSTSGSIVL